MAIETQFPISQEIKLLHTSMELCATLQDGEVGALNVTKLL